MKIAILTHPLGANYGGILQAYALSTYLKKEGHTVVVLNRQHDMFFAKRIIKSLMIAVHHPRYNSHKYNFLVNFIKQRINYTKPINTTHKLTKYVRKNKIDLVIVGSDQVWRIDFATSYGYNYYLDFVPEDIKKTSYAASFGLKEWKYSESQTKEIKRLLNRFEAISVREDEGVEVCQKYLDKQASHVLDPTLLLHEEDYEAITSKRLLDDNYIFVYWLGNDQEKQKALQAVDISNKKIVDISLRENETLIKVEDWLSYIKHSDYVITDSFHGCIFSLIFKKQLYVSPNNSGGTGRLRSLFTALGLTNMATGHNCIINYTLMMTKLELERCKSYEFLKKILR